MTTLAIHTHESKNIYVSRWQCGLRSGEIQVAPPRGAQPRLLAELLALSHLAVHKKVIGLDRGVSELTLSVSEPGVARAVQDPAASSAELRLRSRALRVRFSDATFTACDMPPALLPGYEMAMLATDRPIDWAVPFGEGAIVVTEHAVKQVQHRHGFTNRGYAFRFVQRWAKRQLRPATLPPAVLAEKLSRYADPGLIVCDDTGWHGVIVNKTLVTMFLRDNRK